MTPPGPAPRSRGGARARGRFRARLGPFLRAVAGGAGLVAVSLAVAFAVGHEALVDEARFARPLDAVVIVDRDGAPLRRLAPDGIDSRWVELESISPDVVEAFVAAEDARFYSHAGVDGRALLRAIAVDLVPGGRLSGASTITQQLVKLVYGRPHGLWEKPLEIARALELERRMTKDEILEQYLNRVPMGNGIVGVGRAAEAYFGRPVSELGLAEAALLAGIPQGPSITEPRRHLERALERRRYVLERMRALGWRTDVAIDSALASAPEIATSPPGPWRAARFVDRAIAERSRRAIVGSPLRTSLDLALTDRAESALDAAIERLSARGAENGAALALSVRTGELLVYVGAADTREGAPGAALDLLAARRQPGSTLKPFAYELFFERGGAPATMLADVSSAMTAAGGELYVARDFDGRERGPVSARHALAGSLNLAALDVVRRTTPAAFVDRLGALGLDVAGADREAAALVLGGIDVTPIELARAYATLARGGTPIGTTTFAGTEPSIDAPLLDPAATALVRDVLEDSAARRTAFGADLEDEAGGPFALKTGTSAGFHDAWTVAFDDDFVVVVWLGSPSRRAMDGVTGFSAAAPIAASILGDLRRAHADDPLLSPSPSLSSPSSTDSPGTLLATVEVCALSGALPHAGCTHRVLERFARGHEPTSTCTIHDATGHTHLPPAFSAWLARAPHDATSIARGDRRPRIRSPHDGARLAIAAGTAPEVPLRADGDVVTWELDGTPLPADRWRATLGRHVLVAIGPSSRSSPVAFSVIAP